MREDYPLVGSFNKDRYTNIDSQRIINAFVYINPEAKKSIVGMPTAGILAESPNFAGQTKGFRAHEVFQFGAVSKQYCVVGTGFYSIDSSLTVALLGTLPTEEGYVAMAANTFQILVVDGTKGFIFDTNTNTFTQVTHPNFPSKPIDCCILDDFFIVINGGSNVWAISDLNQGLTYPAQAEITAQAGTLVGCKTLHRRLFLFSQSFTEVWENLGVPGPLPLRRNNALLLETGLAAIGGAQSGIGGIFFPASQGDKGSGSIMRISGTQAIPISTPQIDFMVAEFADHIGISDARGILMQKNGIVFYRLNFTAANKTLVYNVSMSTESKHLWHEEEVLNGDRHPAQTHVYFNGVNYYGSYKAPTLYSTRREYLTNDGEDIKRTFIGRPIGSPDYRRRRIDRFWIDLIQGDISLIGQYKNNQPLLTEGGFVLFTESGLPILVEQPIFVPNGEDQPPRVYLSVSKDGAVSYGNEVVAYMGRVGERTSRTVWRKLGVIPRGQYFVPKVEFYSENLFVLLGAMWDYEDLPE